MKTIDGFVKKHELFFHWYNFIVFFLALRLVTDYSYGLIYSFIIIMLIIRIQVEKIALTFFSISIIVYIFGMNVEANHYFSFVYGFLVIVLLKNLLAIIRRKTI